MVRANYTIPRIYHRKKTLESCSRKYCLHIRAAWLLAYNLFWWHAYWVCSEKKSHFTNSYCLLQHLHIGPENLKKSRPKKLVKSNKSISRKFYFDQIPFFLQFQKWPKINFRTRKKFKTARNAISQKKFLVYLISWVFLPGLF